MDARSGPVRVSPYVGIPMLMVNGNTTAFDVPQYQKSCRLIPQHFRELHPSRYAARTLRRVGTGRNQCFSARSAMDIRRPDNGRLDDSLQVSFRTGIFPIRPSFTIRTIRCRTTRTGYGTRSGDVEPRKGTFTAPLPQEGFRFGFVTLKDVRLMSVSTSSLAPNDLKF